MESYVHLNVIEARALPVMNKNTELTDAFAEINFCGQYFKTQLVWDTLNPVFSSETFKFKVTDSDLMLQLLHIRLMDYDSYSTNKVIGKVSISLSPLVIGYPNNSLSGWFPLYDTMQGNRGYLRISVRLELFDEKKRNLFRKNNFHIYTFDSVPFGWNLVEMQALINPILVEDDTEDYFTNFIRSSRSSNEARQSLFRDLYARLTNEMVSMAISLGSNAVLGFKVSFDIEGETRVIARAIGTCVTLANSDNMSPSNTTMQTQNQAQNQTQGICVNAEGLSKSKRQTQRLSSINRSSDYHFFDPDNIDLDYSMISLRKNAIRYKNGIYNQPICNLKTIPKQILGPIGGVVTTMAIRVVENKHTSYMIRLNKNWWEELRIELRRQCMNLNCDMIGGYSEVVTMHNKMMAIVSYGTAFTNNTAQISSNLMEDCSPCHSSLNSNSDLFQMKYSTCQVCKSATVPEMIICNLIKPDTLETNGLGCFIQTSVYRKFNENNKDNACFQLSQDLTIAYYELLNKLIHKIKVMGFNSLFNLTIDVSMNDESVVFTGTGTCYLVKALPIPHCPIIEISSSFDSKKSPVAVDTLTSQICEYINKMRKYVQSSTEKVDFWEFALDSSSNHDTSKIIIKIEDDNPSKYLSRLMDPIYLDVNSYHITNTYRPLPASNSNPIYDAGSTDRKPNHSFVINLVRTISFDTSSLYVPEHESSDSYYNSEFNKKLENEINQSIEYLYFKLRHFDNCSIHNIHVEILKNEDLFFLRIFANIDCCVTCSDYALLYDENDQVEVAQEKDEVIQDYEEFMQILNIPLTQESNFVTNQSKIEESSPTIISSSGDSLCQSCIDVEIDFSDVVISCSNHFSNPLDHQCHEHVGILNFIFIREITDLKKSNSIGIVSFINSFFDDVQGIARAYAKSLNANYILGFNVTNFQIDYKQDVSDAYCLCQVSGDMFTKKPPQFTSAEQL